MFYELIDPVPPKILTAMPMRAAAALESAVKKGAKGSIYANENGVTSICVRYDGLPTEPICALRTAGFIERQYGVVRNMRFAK